MKQATVNYEQFFIEDIAILEVRHFHKELRLPYTTLVFIEIGYISSLLNARKDKEINGIRRNVLPMEQPKDKDFIEYYQLSEALSDTETNSLLVDMLKKTIDFYGANFVFSLIAARDSFSESEVIWIVNYSLEKSKIRKSFNAQHHMLGFIDRNKSKMDSILFEKALKEFPHANLGGKFVD